MVYIENSNHIRGLKGCVEVISGSMFSGKTEELLRRIRRAEFARFNTILFKPKTDTRYSDNAIITHNNTKIESIPVEYAHDIIRLSQKNEVIGIDEAQFFDDELVNVCNELANQGIRVIVAGLDMDFLGRPFGPLPALMAIAESVTKLHAICMDCGDLAQYSYRKTKGDDIVMLGEKDLYEPLCRVCFASKMAQIR